MAPLIVGLGYDWAIQQTAKCIGGAGGTFSSPNQQRHRPRRTLQRCVLNAAPPPVSITCKPGDSLEHIEDGSIDAVVMDPPYYDNVMYAELSDFFYVWLKRTAGHVFPELFRTHLTDKDGEAVANVARFRGQKGAKARAGRDYQERMASIFAECRRTLKPGGIMTLMFTHKAAGAWDALTTGLMEARFAITASWPINTESPGSTGYQGQSCGEEHDTPRLPPSGRAGHHFGPGDAVLGGYRTSGCQGRSQPGEVLPESRNPWCGFVFGVLRTGAGGVLTALAPTSRPPAPRSPRNFGVGVRQCCSRRSGIPTPSHLKMPWT